MNMEIKCSLRANPHARGGYVVVLSRLEIPDERQVLLGMELDERRQILHGGFIEISDPHHRVRTGGVVDPRLFAKTVGLKIPRNFRHAEFTTTSVLEERTFAEFFRKTAGVEDFAASAFRPAEMHTPSSTAPRTPEALGLLVALVGTAQGYVWTSEAASSSSKIVVNGNVVQDTAQAAERETENGKTLRSVRRNCELGKCEEASLVGVGGVIQSFLQRGFN